MKKHSQSFLVEVDGSGNRGFAAVLYADDLLVDFILEKLPDPVQKQHFHESNKLNIGFICEIYAVAAGITLILDCVESGVIPRPAVIPMHTDSEGVMKYLYSPHNIKSEMCETIIKKIIKNRNNLSKKGVEVEISRSKISDHPHNFASDASRGITSPAKKKQIISEHLTALLYLGNPVFDPKILVDSENTNLTISECLFKDLIEKGYTYAATGKLTGRDPETVRTTVLRAKIKTTSKEHQPSTKF